MHTFKYRRAAYQMGRWRSIMVSCRYECVPGICPDANVCSFECPCVCCMLVCRCCTCTRMYIAVETEEIGTPVHSASNRTSHTDRTAVAERTIHAYVDESVSQRFRACPFLG